MIGMRVTPTNLPCIRSLLDGSDEKYLSGCLRLLLWDCYCCFPEHQGQQLKDWRGLALKFTERGQSEGYYQLCHISGLIVRWTKFCHILQFTWSVPKLASI
mmetsp:Transcript_50110/g.92578  ORF Transcript_50110/g.92578 Transcript_50110/m.92578 type:complete len:101 (-) Transcript_50110:90-392(-)